MQDKFYAIKLVNTKTGKSGYLRENAKGGIDMMFGPTHDFTQFKTYQKAQHYLRGKNIEKAGIKAYIKNNEDMMRELAADPNYVPMKSDMFCIENQDGLKLFYSSILEIYHFDTPNVGFCAWTSEEAALDFNEEYKFKDVSIKKMEIQANGK